MAGKPAGVPGFGTMQFNAVTLHHQQHDRVATAAFSGPASPHLPLDVGVRRLRRRYHTIGAPGAPGLWEDCGAQWESTQQVLRRSHSRRPGGWASETTVVTILCCFVVDAAGVSALLACRQAGAARPACRQAGGIRKHLSMHARPARRIFRVMRAERRDILGQGVRKAWRLAVFELTRDGFLVDSLSSKRLSARLRTQAHGHGTKSRKVQGH